MDWDESPEGHHLRFGADDQLVEITIVNARRLLEDEGRIVITLPERRLEIADLGDVFAAA